MLVCPRCTAPCGETHSFCFACGGALEHDAANREDPLIGRTLPGGYRVTHMVGIGGMGRVYCAEQVALGRTVAVKVVHPHLADDELAAARFLNEARTASRLSHPNSVAIFDFGRTEQGQPYIVMEYLRGRDLGRVAHDEGPLPMRRVADVLKQTLAALEEAHALGIVHRDLKPDNIVLEPLRSGLDFVKVVDFGLAKILEDAPAPSTGRGALTRPGLVCGTPEYMSPEQGRGDTLDGRADLYSVGIVLFELLTGRMPFSAETATKTLLMQLNDPAPDPRNFAPERAIPPSFATIALRALAKPREERFQTAREFSDALEQAMTDVEGRVSRDMTPTTGLRCRSCGALNALGQKFCGDCGASISTSAAPAGARPSPAPRVHDVVGPTMTRTAAVGGGLHSLPLTARATALDWLESRRHEAEASFALAHVVGEAGAGKTRLVHEFGARCASRGDVVVTVGPDPAWAKIGGHTVRDAIRALLQVPADQAVDGAAHGAPASARRGLEAVWDVSDRPANRHASPAACRREVADALRWAMSKAAGGAGQGLVVLVVDDIDFIDGASRNAFVDVTADPPSSGGLLVVTYAPGTSPVEPLDREAWTLEPLPVEAFADLLPSRYAEAARPLWPLHVEQLIAWSRESKEPAPDRLADLIARRTERLPADARHALHALAVWGDDATADSIGKMLPAPVDLDAALDTLDKAKIVSIDERGLRIAHPLVRRVVASTIPAGRKRELFARAGELRPDAALEIRARQAMHGGSAFEGLSLLEVLAQKRATVGDTAGSVSALRHALDMTRRELHRGELDDPLAAMLIFSRKLAEALATSGQWTDAEGVLREALGNAPPTSEHRARLLGVLARVAQGRSNPTEARRYLDEAMRVARQSESRELMPLLQKIEASLQVA
jgi:serine/threonine-protein kinase